MNIVIHLRVPFLRSSCRRVSRYVPRRAAKRRRRFSASDRHGHGTAVLGAPQVPGRSATSAARPLAARAPATCSSRSAAGRSRLRSGSAGIPSSSVKTLVLDYGRAAPPEYVEWWHWPAAPELSPPGASDQDAYPEGEPLLETSRSRRRCRPCRRVSSRACPPAVASRGREPRTIAGTIAVARASLPRAAAARGGPRRRVRSPPVPGALAATTTGGTCSSAPPTGRGGRGAPCRRRSRAGASRAGRRGPP